MESLAELSTVVDGLQQAGDYNGVVRAVETHKDMLPYPELVEYASEGIAHAEAAEGDLALKLLTYVDENSAGTMCNLAVLEGRNLRELEQNRGSVASEVFARVYGGQLHRLQQGIDAIKVIGNYLSSRIQTSQRFGPEGLNVLGI